MVFGTQNTPFTGEIILTLHFCCYIVDEKIILKRNHCDSTEKKVGIPRQKVCISHILTDKILWNSIAPRKRFYILLLTNSDE